MDWRITHGETINEFLQYMNKQSSDYILKGGTSLMTCYGLDRFSEDIDLDCVHSAKIKTIVDDFCNIRGYTYRVAKDTNTVKRFMINYGNDRKPLKIEVSYRKKIIEPSEYTRISGITVYNIDDICRMKMNAYISRDKIRDLYDLSFICKNYWDSLSNNTIKSLRDCISFKGLEQFDYLIKTQSDELINNDKLAEDFLIMYDKLGLLVDDDEQQFIPEQNEKTSIADKIKAAQDKADKLNQETADKNIQPKRNKGQEL